MENISLDEKYGPVEHGLSGGSEYLTPYQTTILYNPNSVFETAVAFLSDRVQLIPVNNSTEGLSLVNSCEHPSPNVIVFGTDLSHETLLAFFNKHFQHIYIFMYPGMVNKYVDDPRITAFTINEIYEHIELISGMVSSFILEHIIMATHSDFNGMFRGEITHETGKHFLKALTDESVESGVHLGVALLNLCKTGYRGFDNVKAMVITGQSSQKIYNRIALHCVSKGIFYSMNDSTDEKLDPITVYAIGGDIVPDDVRLLIRVDTPIVIIYNLEIHTIDNINYPGWRITAVKTGQLSAIDFLKRYSDAIGDDDTSTAWVPTGAAKHILPFIYP